MSKAKGANMADVGGLRNKLGVFVGMRVMLLKNMYNMDAQTQIQDMCSCFV